MSWLRGMFRLIDWDFMKRLMKNFEKRPEKSKGKIMDFNLSYCSDGLHFQNGIHLDITRITELSIQLNI